MERVISDMFEEVPNKVYYCLYVVIIVSPKSLLRSDSFVINISFQSFEATKHVLTAFGRPSLLFV